MKTIFSLSDRTLVCVVFAFALGLSGFANHQATAQDRGRDERFDAMRYLQRADRDENGMLDQRELGGRLEEWVKEMGIDTSKPVPLSKITKVYEAQKKAEADEKRAAEIDGRRKVSKFGSDIEMVPPPDFSVTNRAGANGRLEDQYDKEMVDTVRAYMRRYDENKDGWLDENESRRISRILGDDADADDDGKLGEMEIAAGLKERMEQRGRDGGDRGRGDRGRGDRGRGDRGRGESSRGGERSFRGSPAPESRSDSGSSSKSAATSTPSRSTRSMSGRQTAYVDGIFSRYDEDKSSTLDKNEQKKISGSLKLVDVNGDGVIDRQEALDSLAGTAKPAESSGSSESSSSGRRSRRGSAEDRDSSRGSGYSSRSGNSNSDMKFDVKGFQRIPIESKERTDRETDLRRQGADQDFLAWDEDRDGQISMAEFRGGKKWTDKLVRQFQKLDENNDGLVTIEEFDANYSSRDFDD